MDTTHLVVMGVSGCGKSTVAIALHTLLGWPMAEGDDLHPAANVEKMANGIPLTDGDRGPWLDSIAAWTQTQEASGFSTVVTCSALRRAYRDRLRRVAGRTLFLHLAADAQLLTHRMETRLGHFMPASLLPSQLTTLEPLAADEDGIVIDASRPIAEIVGEAVARLNLGG